MYDVCMMYDAVCVMYDDVCVMCDDVCVMYDDNGLYMYTEEDGRRW